MVADAIADLTEPELMSKVLLLVSKDVNKTDPILVRLTLGSIRLRILAIYQNLHYARRENTLSRLIAIHKGMTGMYGLREPMDIFETISLLDSITSGMYSPTFSRFNSSITPRGEKPIVFDIIINLKEMLEVSGTEILHPVLENAIKTLSDLTSSVYYEHDEDVPRTPDSMRNHVRPNTYAFAHAVGQIVAGNVVEDTDLSLFNKMVSTVPASVFKFIRRTLHYSHISTAENFSNSVKFTDVPFGISLSEIPNLTHRSPELKDKLDKVYSSSEDSSITSSDAQVVRSVIQSLLS